MTQKEALEILKMGHNCFITGAAGSGKTHLLNQYIKYLRENGAEIGITASTGIAATHMGGMTIHSWSGLGIRDELTEWDLEELESRQYLFKRLSKTQVLIIDEVSMLHHFRLDLVERIARTMKRNDRPFGGMQVILCGDFFQLPPVKRAGEREAHFAYHSDSWKNLKLKVCYLEEQHRQSDGPYLEVLNAIRDNCIGERAKAHLLSRMNKPIEMKAEPTRLYTHNADVDSENERHLAKLPGEVREFYMHDKGREPLVRALKNGCLAPETLRLKPGARVMFVKNNFEAGYANGTLGVVTKCGPFCVEVCTAKGKIINVEPAKWQVEESGSVKAEIVQYPLRLAWAITVHKSQGMNLDAAEVDLSQSFERGMGYVALSRVRSLEGLSLKGLNELSLKVHDEVMEFDAEIRALSDEHAKELKAINESELKRRQEEFRKIMNPEGASKKTGRKADTVRETKKMICEGLSVKEIAKRRGLKPETIIAHAEKIAGKDPSCDLSGIAKDMTPAKIKRISAALRRSGQEGGEFLLSPAKNILGESATFEEIRIVRLLMKTGAV